MMATLNTFDLNYNAYEYAPTNSFTDTELDIEDVYHKRESLMDTDYYVQLAAQDLRQILSNPQPDESEATVDDVLRYSRNVAILARRAGTTFTLLQHSITSMIKARMNVDLKHVVCARPINSVSVGVSEHCDEYNQTYNAWQTLVRCRRGNLANTIINRFNEQLYAIKVHAGTHSVVFRFMKIVGVENIGGDELTYSAFLSENESIFSLLYLIDMSLRNCNVKSCLLPFSLLPLCMMIFGTAKIDVEHALAVVERSHECVFDDYAKVVLRDALLLEELRARVMMTAKNNNVGVNSVDVRSKVRLVLDEVSDEMRIQSDIMPIMTTSELDVINDETVKTDQVKALVHPGSAEWACRIVSGVSGMYMGDIDEFYIRATSKAISDSETINRINTTVFAAQQFGNTYIPSKVLNYLEVQHSVLRQQLDTISGHNNTSQLFYMNLRQMYVLCYMLERNVMFISERAVVRLAIKDSREYLVLVAIDSTNDKGGLTQVGFTMQDLEFMFTGEYLYASGLGARRNEETFIDFTVTLITIQNQRNHVSQLVFNDLHTDINGFTRILEASRTTGHDFNFTIENRRIDPMTTDSTIQPPRAIYKKLEGYSIDDILKYHDNAITGKYVKPTINHVRHVTKMRPIQGAKIVNYEQVKRNMGVFSKNLELRVPSIGKNTKLFVVKMEILTLNGMDVAVTLMGTVSKRHVFGIRCFLPNINQGMLPIMVMSADGRMHDIRTSMVGEFSDFDNCVSRMANVKDRNISRIRRCNIDVTRREFNRSLDGDIECGIPCFVRESLTPRGKYGSEMDLEEYQSLTALDCPSPTNLTNDVRCNFNIITMPCGLQHNVHNPLLHKHQCSSSFSHLIYYDVAGEQSVCDCGFIHLFDVHCEKCYQKEYVRSAMQEDELLAYEEDRVEAQRTASDDVHARYSNDEGDDDYDN